MKIEYGVWNIYQLERLYSTHIISSTELEFEEVGLLTELLRICYFILRMCTSVNIYILHFFVHKNILFNTFA